MGKLDLPYLDLVTAKGRSYGYYRRGGRRQRIPGEPGSPAFLQAYTRIHESWTLSAEMTDAPPVPHSVAALVAAYRASPEYRQLAPKTRRDYARYLDRFVADRGSLPAAAMERRHVLTYRNRFADKPATANALVRVIRLVFAWGLDNTAYVKANPAQRPRRLKTGEGHRPWEDWEIRAFRRAWPADSLERVAFELYLNTGQRGGDVAAMTRRDRRRRPDGMWISVTQEKTGERVEIREAKALRAVLTPWLRSRKEIALLPATRPREGRVGLPLTVDALRHRLRGAIRTAGLGNDCTLHGLRYTAATVLRELGLSWPEIADITGHQTAEMARKYSEKRRRVARAIDRLDASNSEAQETAEKQPTAKPLLSGLPNRSRRTKANGD